MFLVNIFEFSSRLLITISELFNELAHVIKLLLHALVFLFFQHHLFLLFETAFQKLSLPLLLLLKLYLILAVSLHLLLLSFLHLLVVDIH
jgi:hypothetical protein